MTCMHQQEKGFLLLLLFLLSFVLFLFRLPNRESTCIYIGKALVGVQYSVQLTNIPLQVCTDAYTVVISWVPRSCLIICRTHWFHTWALSPRFIHPFSLSDVSHALFQHSCLWRHTHTERSDTGRSRGRYGRRPFLLNVSNAPAARTPNLI
jgi:hypothetical protein